MRKMSGYDFSQVQNLKKVICEILDRLMEGDDVNDVLKADGKLENKSCVQVISKCNICNFETKVPSALKSHRETIHKVVDLSSPKCSHCNFISTGVVSLKAHEIEKHSKEKAINCLNCDFVTNLEADLKDHIRVKHKSGKRRNENITSTSLSPPFKKKEIDFLVNNEVEMLEIESDVNPKDQIFENRIEELEGQVEKLKAQSMKEKIFQNELVEQISFLRKSSVHSNIPEHLSPVLKEHLPFLHGFKMRYNAKPDGACLTNCLAVHLYENEEQGPKCRQKIIKHMTENWSFYKEEVIYPYTEKIGVGDSSKTVVINNDDEMIAFLATEDALKIYSNSQEVHAIANYFNISLHIFSFGKDDQNWYTIEPNPQMVASDVKWNTDMYLYHSKHSHYDLLVRSDSRIADMSLIAGLSNGGLSNDSSECQEKQETNNKHSKIFPRQGNLVVLSDSPKEDPVKDDQEKCEGEDIENCVSEELVTDSMDSDLHQSSFTSKLVEASKSLLNVHIDTTQTQKHPCNKCDKTFERKVEVDIHLIKVHGPDASVPQSNCNDCSFQPSCLSDLIKDLSATGHLPAQSQSDKRNIIKDFKQCYTCSKVFDGYHSLMNHRKSEHPSNKKCRYYPEKCKFGSQCWYVHDDKTDVDSERVSDAWFKCKSCDESFKEKGNLEEHKLKNHAKVQPSKSNFQDVSSGEGFQQPVVNHPPDQLSKMFSIISELAKKMEVLEKKLEKSTVPMC